jgi:hypothetical protein
VKILQVTKKTAFINDGFYVTGGAWIKIKDSEREKYLSLGFEIRDEKIEKNKELTDASSEKIDEDHHKTLEPGEKIKTIQVKKLEENSDDRG